MTLGVQVPFVVVVDDGVAWLHERGEDDDSLIDWGAGLDKDDDGSGVLD